MNIVKKRRERRRSTLLLEYITEKNEQGAQNILASGGFEVNKPVKLENGEAVNILCHAINYDSMPLARELIDRGANVNKRNGQYTPLETAILKNNVDAVKELISLGANHELAILFAMRNKKIVIVKYLLEQYVSLLDFQDPETRETCLMIAVEFADIRMIQHFLLRGANPMSKNFQGYNCLDINLISGEPGTKLRKDIKQMLTAAINTNNNNFPYDQTKNNKQTKQVTKQREQPVFGLAKIKETKTKPFKSNHVLSGFKRTFFSCIRYNV